MTVTESRTAVVVGMGYLGAAAALQLALEGFDKIVVTNRQLTKAEASAESLRAGIAGRVETTIVPMGVDVADSESIDLFCRKLEATVSEDLDVVLITSGGNSVEATFNKMEQARGEYPQEPVAEQQGIRSKWQCWSAQAMREMYVANATGLVELMYTLGPRLVTQKSAPLVLTIGSVSPQLSGVNHYAAAKQALREETIRFGEYLAWDRRELGLPYGRSVSIRWGFTETTQSKGLLRDEDGNPKFRFVQILGATPVGRFATPEEFGKCVTFIARSPYIMGEFVADGGFSNAKVV